MGINSDHIIGFLLGLGGAAVGYHFYKKNKEVIDAFINDVRQTGRPATPEAFNDLTLEEMMLVKERLEDLIAEKEMATEEAADEDQEPQKKNSGSKKNKKK